MLALKRVRIIGSRSVMAFFEDGCTQRAAAISYYVLFSIFPLVIFSVAIVGLFLRDPELQTAVVDAIMNAIPLSQDAGRDNVTSALERVADERSGALGLIGLVTLAWSASAMFGVVRASLNHVFKVKSPRPIVRQKLLDLGIVLAFAPFFLSSLFVTYALRALRRFSEDIEFLSNIENTMGVGWFIAALTVPILFSFIAFFFIYIVIPARRTPLKYVAPGALLAAILFEAAKIGFSIYLENFATYDVIFGSLGAVVAFLFWVFLSANILLLCGEVVAETPAVMGGAYDVPEPKTGEELTLRQKIWRLARSLVLYPGDDDAAAASQREGDEERDRRPAERRDSEDG